METQFINQVFRKDILTNILLNQNLAGKDLFALIMSDNNSAPSESRQGFLFESIVEIMVLMKCVKGINYTEMKEGDLSSLNKISNGKTVLNKKIHQGGNVSDITIKDGECVIAFSIKYKKKASKKGTDANDLDSTLKKHYTNYKIGLFTKDKTEISASKKNDIHKEAVDTIVSNNLLFDTHDVIIALDSFRSKFINNTMCVDDFIEDVINADYLLSPRKQLVLKLHQKMTVIKFMKSYLQKNKRMWCIAHKPRSGKSITILTICKHLLENGLKKILIMTSVPDTITSFVKDLEEHVDFKYINYKQQEDFESTDEQFSGIVFCSVQYLKTDGKTVKKDILKRIGFELIVTDECHLGGSTDKTKSEILAIDSDIVEDIRKEIKLSIFASGTADKTIKSYGIKTSDVFEWEIIDEGYMKELMKPSGQKGEILDCMARRHGQEFIECFENTTLNRDYSNHPAQVLMKHSIPVQLIQEINEYNAKYGTNYGYNCASLFALRKNKKQEPEKDKKGNIIKTKEGRDYYEYEYVEEFELCKDNDGIEILKGFFECIISKNMMRKNTIMKNIETTQTSRSSRKSTSEAPLLFIIYLPTHTGNNTIATLQRTFKKFLEQNGLWTDYNIEYSNSSDNSSYVNEKEYNKEISGYMEKTKRENKRGCILLLGNKGSVGITYNDCDVTISLDDGHNLDNQKQRFSRSLTGAPGKTIGINVDMNIQRTYLYLNDMIHKHRNTTKTTMTNAEILQYLYEHNIFLFNPQQFNGKCTTYDIITYYQSEAENILREIDDTQILENIVCDDEMRGLIKIDYTTITKKSINKDLEGEQQDCPKGEKTKVQVDGPQTSELPHLTPEESEKIEILINQTYEMCKRFLFPLLALISRSTKIFDFNELFRNEKTKKIIFSLLTYKIEELDEDKYILIINIMNNIIDNNAEIVDNIREIYGSAPCHKIRDLIAKHFIPTQEEKKDNAEVPTPVPLVDDMLCKIHIDFWKTPKKVFEPCCGKGNFILGIFDRFYNGLEEMYPDEIQRCRVIMTECIYYADLTPLNVFITTEILKCHVQSYCGLDELDYEFNQYTGDTLELNIEDKWNIHLEEVSIIGNPPYSTDPSKSDTKPLYDKFIEKYIGGKLLLFVVPSRWFIGGKGLDRFRDFMMKRKDIVFIQHEDNSKKWFGNNVDIEGGVNYFLKDTSYNDVCLFNGEPYDLSKYDCIIKPKYHKIIDIISNMESIIKIYCSSGYFKYRTNDSRLKNNGKIKCYVSLQKSSDRCKYIDNYDFNETNTFWKVITARANGKNPNFGAKFVGNPTEIYTDSYISFRVNNEDEAKSLLSYLETTFANHMLSIRKISQDISENTCKWIPLVPLDRVWTDDKVCEYLKIEKSLYI